MIEVNDFIYKNYPVLQTMYSSAEYENIFKFYHKNIKKYVFIDKGLPQAAALYTNISDNTLQRMVTKEINTATVEGMNILLNDNGNNVFFLMLCSTGNNSKGILLCLDKIINDEKARTVCWYSFDRTKLNIYKTRCNDDNN